MRPRLVAPFVFAALALVGGRASAYERQWHAGLGAGPATLGDEAFGDGWGAGARLTYGMTDAFDALLRVDATRHAGDTGVLAAGAGVAYTLDVLRWVPWAGALGGVYRLDVAGAKSTAPGAQLALGLDYGLTRSVALGAELRWHTILAAEPVGTTSMTTAMVGATWVWGF